MTDKDFEELGRFVYDFMNFDEYIVWSYGEDEEVRELDLEGAKFFLEKDWKCNEQMANLWKNQYFKLDQDNSKLALLKNYIKLVDTEYYSLKLERKIKKYTLDVDEMQLYAFHEIDKIMNEGK